MAPPRRKRKQSSPETTRSMVPSSNILSTPPSLAPRSPNTIARPKSPLRRVADGQISKANKQLLVQNLRTEIEERQRRLRATYADLARAVKQKIELRIHRVPRKFWDMKMGDLLKTAEGEEALKVIRGESLSETIRDIKSSGIGTVVKKPESTVSLPPLKVPQRALPHPPTRPLSPVKRPASPFKRPSSPMKSDPVLPTQPTRGKRVTRKAPIPRTAKPASSSALSSDPPMPSSSAGIPILTSDPTEPDDEPLPIPKKRLPARKDVIKKPAKAAAPKPAKGLTHSSSLKENDVQSIKAGEKPVGGRRVLRSRK